MTGVAIIGAGQAGLQAAISLREAGYQEAIRLIGDEPEPPYQRPPLSKAFLKGDVELPGLTLRPAEFFAKNRIELLCGERVVRIDRASRRVELASGSAIGFAHLVIATGSVNRRLQADGTELSGIHYLRNVREASDLKRAFDAAENVVVVGGGFIGLEVAAVAAGLGKNVTVIEAAPRLMARAISPSCSNYFGDFHRRLGIRVIHGETVSDFVGDGGKLAGVRIGSSQEIPADLAIVGIGATADERLAKDAGLNVGGGIRVDANLATSDPAIVAIGDCTVFTEPNSGASIRLESVQNAIDQGKYVAAKIAGSASPSAYAAVPWFWSDQASAKLQIAGFAIGTDRDVIRGNMEENSFSVFRFRAGRLLAVDSVNAARDHMAARKLLGFQIPISPEMAADPGIDLKTLVTGAR